MIEEQAERTLVEYANITPNTNTTSIVRPAVTAQKFEIKPSWISLVLQEQLSGTPHEDPNDHLTHFLSVLDFFKIQGATDEAIRLRLFPFSLRDRAKSWLISQPQGSITTWDELTKKFVDKYFPPSKQAKLRQDISAFVQQDGESLHEAWERYRAMLQKCPTHSMPDWMQIRLFYEGLKTSNKDMIDAAASGALDSKTPTQARELIEKMANNSSHASTERLAGRKEVLELDAVQTLMIQNKEMQQQIAQLTKQVSKVQVGASVSIASSANSNEMLVLTCDFCGGNHHNGECAIDTLNDSNEERVNFVGGAQRNNPYSNTYNPGYRNHPNLSWKSPALQPPQEKPQAWELAMEKLAQQTSTIAQSTNSFMEEARANFKNQGASIRNLEVQVGQISKQISERSPGTFPSDTIPNPKEQCKAITLRSGKSLEEEPKKKNEEEILVDLTQEEVEKDEELPLTSHMQPEESNKQIRENDQGTKLSAKVPFPQRLKKHEKEKQFSKFMEVFKRLQINIPFAKALEQMQTYAKFMKELLTNKRKMKDDESVMLTEECSVSSKGSYLQS